MKKLIIPFLLSMLFVNHYILMAQTSVLGNIPSSGSDYLGWYGSATIPLTIKHEAQYPIIFSTYNGSSQGERMRITDAGNVGIGSASPAYKLDVSGDLNVASNQVYRIGGRNIVGEKSTNGPRNIFVGYEAGNTLQASTPTTSYGNTCIGGRAAYSMQDGATYNTITGASAAESLTTGSSNVVSGHAAGYSLTTGSSNTLYGNYASYTNSTGSYNVTVGAHAGRYYSNDSYNTFIGYQAAGGNNSPSGVENLCAGALAGFNNSSGYNNSFAGYKAGYSNTTGNTNTALGYMADMGSGGLYNATAIGANAMVASNNSVILGGIYGINSSTTNTNVGIGTTAPTSRLHVVNNAENIAGYFNATYAPMTDIIKGIYNQTSTGDINGVNISLTTSSTTGSLANVGYRTSVTSSSTETTQKNYGVFAITSGASIENHAVYGDASSTNNDTGSKNYGGKLFAHKGAAYTPETNYGVWGKGYEAGTNYGGYFIGTDGTTNYGVYATAGSTGTNYAAYFSGDGVLTGSGWSSSDISLKQNIEPIADNLSIISQLQPKKFEFRTNEYPQINLSSGQHYGLIAQELQLVLPDLVRSIIHPSQYDSLGNETFSSMNYLAVNYMELIPFLIGAIKEQQQQIDDLNSRLTSCCGPGIQEFQVPDNGYNQPSTITHQPLASVARDLPVLSQNQPNPFGEKTVIRFYIPKATKDAAIKVFDNTGSVYRLFSITGEGPGAIELEANSLAAGSYYYSLLIGGNVIDTKVMVITK